jgi:hypothetical protein
MPFSPAGHSAHDVWPGNALYVPPLQLCRRPATQYSPGTQEATPVRFVPSATSGVEYHPVGTPVGLPAPPTQYTVAFPQGVAVSFIDPAVQKYPGLQGPEQAALSIPTTLPKRPAYGETTKGAQFRGKRVGRQLEAHVAARQGSVQGNTHPVDRVSEPQRLQGSMPRLCTAPCNRWRTTQGHCRTPRRGKASAQRTRVDSTTPRGSRWHTRCVGRRPQRTSRGCTGCKQPPHPGCTFLAYRQPRCR